MTASNLTLYQVLIKLGVTPEEARDAATPDASELATKGDLRELEAKLEAKIEAMQSTVIKWNLVAMGFLATLFMLLRK